jgi:hypothetical protein
MCAATMTALLALAALQGAHIQFMSLLAMGLLWTSFTISYRRRHAITARRASGDLDAAYSLAGATLPATGVGMGVTATPQVRISTDVPAHLAISARPAFEAEAEATAKAEAEAEADREDAFTDFDRRLAEAEKRK